MNSNDNKDSTRQAAKANFLAGLYCAESVVSAITANYGTETHLSSKAATAFCSGMARTCGTCGALTGALLGISSVLGRDKAGESVEDCYAASQTVINKFEQTFGSKQCHELLGCDLGTAEGQQKFRAEQLHERCRSYTHTAAELAADALEQFFEQPIVSLSDTAEACQLLQQNDLPTDDIATATTLNLFGIRGASGLIAIGGLEVMGDIALLRSIAVSSNFRKQRLGKRILSHAEQLATNEGVTTLYLLTTTASDYFRKNGFTEIARQTAPDAIRQTAQFSSLCPSSAIVMKKEFSA